MTAGRLAAAKPGATTNTELYKVDIESTASAVMNVANQSGSAVTYRAAIRDYDQILTLDGDEPSNYEFQKGNPISAYRIKVAPGLTFSEATPGTDISTTGGAVAKLMDVYKDTSVINRYVKVDKLYSIDTLVDNLIGIVQLGETFTGATSGITGVVRAYEGTVGTMYLTTPDVASNATTVHVSRNTGLAENTLLMLSTDPGEAGTEVAQIDASGIDTVNNELTITRGVYGTTPSVIPAGTYIKSFIDSATATTISEGGTYAAADLTLTVTDATGFLEGSFIRIDNELLLVDAVAGNDLTVTRGRYGTSAVDHTDGAAVTQLTDSGDYYLNFFTEGESIAGSASSSTTDLNFTQGTSNVDNRDKFIIATDLIGNPYQFPLSDDDVSKLDNERTYRYDQSDSSNAGHPFRLSEEFDGTQGLTGVEYTTGVTKSGTAGTNGVLIIEVTEATALNLNSYAEPASANTEDGNAGYGTALGTQLTPSYNQLYIYQLRGAKFTDADQFTIGGVTYTIQASGVIPGSWGFVHDFDEARNTLKISLDGASPVFAVGDQFYDTPKLTDENRLMAAIVSGKVLAVDTVSAADASRTEGTYEGISPTGGSGSGLKVKVVVAASTGAATVTLTNGGKDYADGETLTVTDALLGGGGAANLTFDTDGIGAGDKVGATATNFANAEDYISWNTSVAANAYDKVTGLIVGPGQNLLVYSAAADLSYVVTGFETASEDYNFILNTKAQDGGGGAGAAAP